MRSKEVAKVHPRRAGGLFKVLLFGGVILLLFLAGRGIDFAEAIGNLRNWVDEFGPWAPAVFVMVYVVAVVLAMPGAPLTAAGGALFGAVWGVVWVIVAATLGATLAFLVSRYVARDTIRRWLQDRPAFQRLERLTRRQGAVIVAVTRLVPLFPFNLLNYGFGLTSVPLSTYVLWSFVCMLPGTILYVVGVDALLTGVGEGRIPWDMIVVVVLMAVLVGGLIRRAKVRLDEAPAATESNCEERGG